MASVSVMQIEPAQSEFAIHQDPPFLNSYRPRDLPAMTDRDHSRARNSHDHWTTGYSSDYTSSSSSMHSPPIQPSRSHTLDHIDQTLARDTFVLPETTEWTQDNRERSISKKRREGQQYQQQQQRDSFASEWSRDGAVSGWSTRREYSRSDDYRPQVLTLLPLHRLKEGSYSRLDRSGSTTPTHHSRQSSRSSTRQSCIPDAHDSTPTPHHASHHQATPIDHPLHRNSTTVSPFQGNHTSHHSSQGFEYNPHPPASNSHRDNVPFRGHEQHGSRLESFQYIDPSTASLSEQLPWTHPQQRSHHLSGHAHQSSLDGTLQSSSSYFIDDSRPRPEGHSSSTVPLSSRAKSMAATSDKSLVACVLEKLEEVDVDVKRWVVKADCHLQRAEYREAIPYVEAVIVRMQPYHRLQLLLWELLGNTHMAVSNWKKASICHLHHLGYSRALRDFKSITRAECNLGISYLKLGLLKLASRCFLQYLENCKTLRDDWGVQAACSNLGVLSKLAATRAFEQKCSRSDGGKKEGAEASARANLNSGLLKAIIFFKQHLEIVLDYGDVDKQSRAHGNIGSCYELLRDYNEAIYHHKKRLELSRATGDFHSESCTLCHLGNCLRAKGSYDEALEYYQMNLEMCQSLEDVKMEEILHFNMGLTYEKKKQPHQAIVHFTLYLGLVADSGQLEKHVRGFSVLARLYMETEQLPKAQEYYHNLVGIFKKLGDFSSMDRAQLKSRSLLQLIKLEKKRAKKKDGRRSYSPAHTAHKRHSKQHASKVHTISRATNIHREFGGKQPGEDSGYIRAHHERVGRSWDGTDHRSSTMGRKYNTTGRDFNTMRREYNTMESDRNAMGSSEYITMGHAVNAAGHTGHTLRRSPAPARTDPSTEHHLRRFDCEEEPGYESVRVTQDSPLSLSTSRRPTSRFTDSNTLSCDNLPRGGHPLALREDTPPLPPRVTPPIPPQASSLPAPRNRSISLDAAGSSHNSSFGGRYDHLADEPAGDSNNNTNNNNNNTVDHFTSVTSISLDNMDSLISSKSPRDRANNSARSRDEVTSNEGDDSTLYETISQNSRPCEDGNVGDNLSDLPTLTYFPSTLGFGIERDEEEDLIPMDDTRADEDSSQGQSGGDISQRHYQELKEAGLELVRVGLGLAGYEALVGLDGLNLTEEEDGTDKEWEQWKQMREEDIKEGFDFGSSGNSTMQRKLKRKQILKSSDSAPSLANKLH